MKVFEYKAKTLKSVMKDMSYKGYDCLYYDNNIAFGYSVKRDVIAHAVLDYYEERPSNQVDDWEVDCSVRSNYSKHPDGILGTDFMEVCEEEQIKRMYKLLDQDYGVLSDRIVYAKYEKYEG